VRISAWQVRGAIGALSLVVFGVLLGIGADRLWLAHGHGTTVVTVSDATGPDHAAMMAFHDVLKLDDEQTQAIHEILMRSQERVDRAWRSIRAEIGDGVNGAHEEIRLVLTEEQKELFEAWLDRHVRGAPGADRTLLWNH
jgi:hypothetical protein